ncbi:Hypothetical_protein [Hexamita inflata]|uniref:Hypothetical_protein n=1 Tax=Hexamita inflata TaxID=28002 RepID=A0AA86RA16_9EUKA|nr:Hypothetical protein HINF_LOCUS61821 [Hexamita inflata]
MKMQNGCKIREKRIKTLREHEVHTVVSESGFGGQLSIQTIQAIQTNQLTYYCGRQANFDFKKYQLFQNYFLYQFQLYINSMFSSVSFLFYYFFQPFGHRVNQMIDDIQRDLLQRPLYFFIQQVICGTFFRGNPSASCVLRHLKDEVKKK